jgi:inhibitor of growth protein 4
LLNLSSSAFCPETAPFCDSRFSLGVQLENEQRCQQEIEDIKHGLESGSITFDPAKLKFSDEAIEEQKHCIRIADEKVALATQTYDLVSVSVT